MHGYSGAVLPDEPLILIRQGRSYRTPLTEPVIALRIDGPGDPRPWYISANGDSFNLGSPKTGCSIDEWEPLLAVPHDEYLGVTDKLQSLIHTAADLDGLQRRLDNILVDLGQDL